MKLDKFLFTSILVINLWSLSESYKILVLTPLPAKSHYNLGKGVADTLHKRGHEITFVACFASEKPAYREIYIPEIHDLKNDSIVNFDMSNKSHFSGIFNLNTWIPSMLEVALDHKEMMKIMTDKNEHFDLVIVEYFLNEVLYGFSVKFNCPLIVVSPTGLMHWLSRDTGNPTSPANVPNMFLGYTGKMNLLQRTANVAIDVFQEIVGRTHLKPTQARLYKKYFPEESAKVDFYDLRKNIALVFTNSHPSISVTRPLLPNVIEIGGYHIGETKPLTEEYKTILDNAKNGVVYFSMGSNLKSSMFPEAVRNEFLKAFAKLKQTVLWKFETDLPGKPQNVIIKSWMPQSSILTHPNVKVFITHGGLLSTTEAASAGVPLLAIPIFGDQNYNAKATEGRGTGLRIEYTNITETSITWALNELIKNPKYKEAAHRTYKLYHDRPIHPRDLITFYTEHVIRTGGAKHLKSPDISFVSSLLLDVVSVLLVPPLVVLFSTIYLCKKCFNKSPKNKNKKVKSQ